jgi:hypothetical protein
MGSTLMYRGSDPSFAETIERLETELAELRSLNAPPRPRERTLWMVTAFSAIIAVLASVACASAHTRSNYLQQRFDAAAYRLDVKTKDLGTCESQLDTREAAVLESRLER